MVLGSQPRSVETYSVPPWPSLAASMAAYRLRSFSESESWNIRIECSISGLYVMGGRPLQGLDRPCSRYTTRTKNREVVESAILQEFDCRPRRNVITRTCLMLVMNHTDRITLL